MPRKIRVVFFAVVCSLTTFFLAGCGGGGVNTTPPTNQGFTNSNLSGTYVFAVSGSNAGGFFTVAGTLQANGSGTITGGMEDINSPGTLAAPLLNVPITGSYAVRSDGRAIANISTTGLSPNLTFAIDFVLLSNTHGLAIRFDGNGTASGSLDMQTSQTLSALAGTLAFSLSGVDTTGTQNPEGAAGLATIDASGNLTSGVIDVNDAGVVSTNIAITPAAGAVSSPSGGRGTIAITSSATSSTIHFVYYVIDANHLKLIESDTFPILAGDVFRQTTTSVSGSFAYTLAGATANGHGVFVAGGVMNTDGAGNILNTSVEDIDDGGAVTPAAGSALTGTYAVSGGRGTVTLITSPETLHAVFYPSTGGLLMLDTDSTLVAGGTAVAQSGAPFSNTSLSGAFGLNFTGVAGLNTAAPSEIDAVAQLTPSSGSLSGAMDFNNFGATNSSLALTGNYAISANGRGTGTLTTSLGTQNVIFYVASGSKALFIETDPATVSAGLIAVQ
jgi:hypothetical protein